MKNKVSLCIFTLLLIIIVQIANCTDNANKSNNSNKTKTVAKTFAKTVAKTVAKVESSIKSKVNSKNELKLKTDLSFGMKSKKTDLSFGMNSKKANLSFGMKSKKANLSFKKSTLGNFSKKSNFKKVNKSHKKKFNLNNVSDQEIEQRYKNFNTDLHSKLNEGDIELHSKYKSHMNKRHQNNGIESEPQINAETEVKRLTNEGVKKTIKKTTTTTEEKPAGASLIPTDPNKILNHENLKPILEGWLSIASEQFRDTKLFPEIILRNYDKRNVKADEQNYRVNEFYEDYKPGDKTYPPTRLSFYFRYSDKNLYYSSFPGSIKVLGSLGVKEIKEVILNDHEDFSTCIKITSINDVIWNICTPDRPMRMKWLCAFFHDMGIDESECHKISVDNISPTIMETKTTQPIILIPYPAQDCNEKWNYDNHGTDWECECSEGKEQSPIDLPGATKGKAAISKVKPLFYYDKIPAKFENATEDGMYNAGDNLRINYTESTHSINIKHPNFGAAVTLDGIYYQAKEIRFHTPSEHTIDGKKYEMEIEIIHYGQTKGDAYKQLVFNILFTAYPGIYNKFIEDLDLFNLPNPVNPTKDILHELNINKMMFETEEAGGLNQKYFSFYTYMGSLSSPPCTQNTIHIVSADPVRLGTTALSLFKEALKVPESVDLEGNVYKSKGLTDNSRKTQPLNGRKIYYYQNTIKNDPAPSVDPETGVSKDGHYEKITKQYYSYYKVDGSEPSKLPGAFLTSKAEALGLNKKKNNK